MILPVAVFVLASAGAVSTVADKESDAKKVFTTEYFKISGSSTNCDDVNVENCSPQLDTYMCSAINDETSLRQNVYRKNVSGQCSIPLYTPIAPE